MASSLARMVVAPPRKLWSTYMERLHAAPVATKAFTSLVSAVMGDALAQYLSRPLGKAEWRYDWGRTARLAIFNGAFMGPLGHHYYKLLDASVLPHAPKSLAAIASKLAIDQLIFAPVCTLIFYAYKVATELRAGEYVQELNDKYLPTLLAGYRLWVPAHIVNFAFVPPNQRILYANVVSVAGTYVLSRAQAGDYSSRKHEGGTAAAGRRMRLRADEVVFDSVLLADRNKRE